MGSRAPVLQLGSLVTAEQVLRVSFYDTRQQMVPLGGCLVTLWFLLTYSSRTAVKKAGVKEDTELA